MQIIPVQELGIAFNNLYQALYSTRPDNKDFQCYSKAIADKYF